MADTNHSNKTYLSIFTTYFFIFAVGLTCMTVAGYFLVEGLSQFSGSAAAKRMLIIGGILFQMTESICFISASSLTSHSRLWRYILITLGVVLFSFSIGVMTLAQKTALQTGEAQATAIDEKRAYVRKQIASLDSVIASYRFNAERQSKSIYKDSRALGQDSINRAAQLEEKKIALSEDLFHLNESRKQTSSDFFHRLEQVTHLPAIETEFYFLVLRSLLLELCGIIMMSFGANLRAYSILTSSQENSKKKTGNYASGRGDLPQRRITGTRSGTQAISPNLRSASNTANITTSNPARAGNDAADHGQPTAEFDELIDPPNGWASPKIRRMQLKKRAGITETELECLAAMVIDLFDQKMIEGLGQDVIRNGLNEHCGRKISSEKAHMVSQIVRSRQEGIC